jgi:RimJ/RimL family protein N-acetyltransferase
MTTNILGEDTDKQGAKLVIRHSNTLAGSIPYTFFLRQMADLMDSGFALKRTAWDDDNCGIIWAEMENKIVGIIAYDKDKIQTAKVLSIRLTAVNPDFRNRGIHTIMNKHFEALGRSLGCTRIQATVHPDNQVRLASAKKDGLKTFFHIMYKVIV